MCDGSAGKCGSPGNEESVTYRFQTRPNSSNRTLTAILFCKTSTCRHSAIRSVLTSHWKIVNRRVGGFDQLSELFSRDTPS